jgi:hypothetical protein
MSAESQQFKLYISGLWPMTIVAAREQYVFSLVDDQGVYSDFLTLLSPSDDTHSDLLHT